MSAQSPYVDLPKQAFWKSGVVQENPFHVQEIIQPKFKVEKQTKIATAGSCFAQHITAHLKRHGLQVLDAEPAPSTLAADQHTKYGYSIYSARYGNIYTVRQLLQLCQEISGERELARFAWQKNGRFFDALRPGVEPDGYASAEEVISKRQSHLSKVKSVFEDMDLFIFTLGLTEAWIDQQTQTVFPTAPGTIAGNFNPDQYSFKNFQFIEILADFNKFQQELQKIRRGRPLKILLTVSPVPLTATASGKHVLVSTTYSKAILRAVAGQLSDNQPHIDYFPSYEIVNNPRLHSIAFADNLRTVRSEVVSIVMQHFSKAYLPQESANKPETPLKQQAFNPQCEEMLLETFSNKTQIKQEPSKSTRPTIIQVIGNSFLNPFKACLEQQLSTSSLQSKVAVNYFPVSWMTEKWHQISWVWLTDYDDYPIKWGQPITVKDLLKEHQHRLANINYQQGIPEAMCFVGIFGLNRTAIMDLHPNQKPNQLDDHGRYIKHFRANGIPIIEKESQCNPAFIERLTTRIKACKFHIEQILSAFDAKQIRIFDGPLMSETCGRYWMGDDYVDSGTQAIYNQIISNIINEHLSEHINDGIITLVDSSHYANNGFTKAAFSKGRPEDDMHPQGTIYNTVINPFINHLNHHISTRPIQGSH